MMFFTYYSDSSCSTPLEEVRLDGQFVNRLDILALAFSNLISKMNKSGLNPNKYFLKISNESAFNYVCDTCSNKGYYLSYDDNGDSIMLECDHGG